MLKAKEDSMEIEKSTVHTIVDIAEYLPGVIVSKTIIKKPTGNVSVSSVNEGEEPGEKNSAFDMYIQIIDGAAQLIINKKLYRLTLGEGIIIPAHATHSFKANEQFKMISIIIKSGYED